MKAKQATINQRVSNRIENSKLEATRKTKPQAGFEPRVEDGHFAVSLNGKDLITRISAEWIDASTPAGGNRAPSLYKVTEWDDLGDVVALMQKHNLHLVVVLKLDSSLIGVVSLAALNSDGAFDALCQESGPEVPEFLRDGWFMTQSRLAEAK